MRFSSSPELATLWIFFFFFGGFGASKEPIVRISSKFCQLKWNIAFFRGPPIAKLTRLRFPKRKKKCANSRIYLLKFSRVTQWYGRARTTPRLTERLRVINYHTTTIIIIIPFTLSQPRKTGYGLRFRCVVVSVWNRSTACALIFIILFQIIRSAVLLLQYRTVFGTRAVLWYSVHKPGTDGKRTLVGIPRAYKSQTRRGVSSRLHTWYTGVSSSAYCVCECVQCMWLSGVYILYVRYLNIFVRASASLVRIGATKNKLSMYRDTLHMVNASHASFWALVCPENASEILAFSCSRPSTAKSQKS